MLRTVVLFLILCSADAAIAQQLRMVSPVRNQRICLGATVPVRGSIRNADSVARTLVLHVEINNISNGITVYSSADTIASVLASTSTAVVLPDYVTDPAKLSQLGSFVLVATLSALDSSMHPISNWPYTEADRYAIFGIRQTTTPFEDNANNYIKSGAGGVDLPDQYRWVNQGATVVDGENETWDPPPPRDPLEPIGPDSLRSPVIRLDNIGTFGDSYIGVGTGDTLASFPVNLGAKTRVLLTFDFMRSGRHEYPALWETTSLTGPETSFTDFNGHPLQSGDSLILEFAAPGSDACDTAAISWYRILGIGGGQDFRFQSGFIRIEDDNITTQIGDPSVSTTISLSQSYLTSSFRFRFRVKASDQGSAGVKDDADAFYLDDIHLQSAGLPAVEVLWARVVTPYTKIPYSATAALPVYVALKSYGAESPIEVPLYVTITDSLGHLYYDRQTQIPQLPSFGDTIVRVPDWNAQFTPMPGKYTVHAELGVSGYDSYSEDDATNSIFFLNSKVSTLPGGRGEFAYDDAGLEPGPAAGNDIPFLTRVIGDGIGFSNSTGSYAVKYTLPRPDTIYGANVFFANGNASPDAIRISLHVHNASTGLPGDTLRQESTQASFQDVRRGAAFNQFWPYYFPKPIVVDSGSYWIVVSQLSLDNMMMGGDLSRGGARLRVADPINPQFESIYTDPYGTEYSETNNSGDISGAYAVESPAASGSWQPWMPASGYWPASSHTTIKEATAINPQLSAPQSAGGAYLPMIRMIVGHAEPAAVRHGMLPDKSLTMSPNPANPGKEPISIYFGLSAQSQAKIEIYDVMGRIVRAFESTQISAGDHSVVWDCRDAVGQFVTQGSYFVRVSTADTILSGRIVVVE
jgi:hypothetical protein